MGRKDLTDERSAEILDAFGRSMIKHGLDVSLEQVAQEAGMTRSIIRHYIGNREEVVNALVERVTRSFVDEMRTAADTIPEDRLISESLDYLFDDYTPDDYEKLLIDVLMTAQDRYPQAKQMLLAMLEDFVDILAGIIQRAYPHATKTACQDVAYSIIAMALSNDSFIWLGMDKQRSLGARRLAEALIQTLDHE